MLPSAEHVFGSLVLLYRNKPYHKIMFYGQTLFYMFTIAFISTMCYQYVYFKGFIYKREISAYDCFTILNLEIGFY